MKVIISAAGTGGHINPGIAIANKIKEKEPKSENSYRCLRIPEVVAVELRKRKKRIDSDKDKMGELYKDCGYISVQENGLPHSVNAMNTALTKLNVTPGH